MKPRHWNDVRDHEIVDIEQFERTEQLDYELALTQAADWFEGMEL